MKLRGFVEEDFVQYRKPSMFLGVTTCDWKCCKECGMPTSMCQNSSLATGKIVEVGEDILYKRYKANPITQAIVIGGLEPILSFYDVVRLIDYFRTHGDMSDFVIYTGYYPNEIQPELAVLSGYKNIVMKFGRYIPNKNSKQDDVLGVTLASDNQYAERIS